MPSLERLSEKLKQTKNKLNWLLALTQYINENRSEVFLFEYFTSIIREELGIQRYFLFVKRKGGWECVGSAGFGDVQPHVLDKLMSVHSDVAVINPVDVPTLSRDFDIFIPVFHKDIGLGGVIIGDIDAGKIGISPSVRHLRFIQTLLNIIMVSVENKRMHREIVASELIKRELEMAGEIQNKLLNVSLPSHGHIECSAIYIQSRYVGGDYYDFISVDDHNYLFCVGDATGKGVMAGIVMTSFQSCLRTLANFIVDIEQMAVYLNRMLYRQWGGETFVACSLALYNTKTHILEVVNCGNVPCVVITPDKPVIIDSVIYPLGIVPELSVYPKKRLVKIEGRAVLLMYSDGVLNPKKSETSILDKGWFGGLVNSICDMSAEEIKSMVIEGLKRENAGKDDDVAFLIVKING